ncbi:hypothetical protein I7I48_11583 [Histoplasma ohiense]|nr:hypothetical protein I7I48_11583 [Histoplasma ohiense (nom. inval.)]
MHLASHTACLSFSVGFGQRIVIKNQRGVRRPRMAPGWAEQLPNLTIQAFASLPFLIAKIFCWLLCVAAAKENQRSEEWSRSCKNSGPSLERRHQEPGEIDLARGKTWLHMDEGIRTRMKRRQGK